MENGNILRIMFIEDVPEDAEIAARELRKAGLRFESMRVDTGEDFLAALTTFDPTVIISDYVMPRFDGMKALKLSMAWNPTIPFIVLTGSKNEETAVLCLKAGAYDYVIKGHISRLPFAVLEALDHARAMREQDESTRALIESEKHLKQLLAEKATLLRELFHRTRNNMQVIIAILSLEEGIVDDERFSRIVHETSNRIMSMSLVHKKLYESGDLSTIDLKDYTEELIETLMSDDSFPRNRVSVKTSVESMPMLIDTAVPCGLVIRELVSNAFRHAYPGGGRGEVRINIARTLKGDIELDIADDGVGLPKNFDYNGKGTLGFQLVHGLVERQLGGSLSFESTRGLSCHVSFMDERILKRL